jgi:hypothetical protein
MDITIFRNITLIMTYTENLPSQITSSPKTHVILININLVPYDIFSVELNHTQMENVTNTKKDLSSNTYYMSIITITNSISDRATSNPTTKNLHNLKDGQQLHI